MSIKRSRDAAHTVKLPRPALGPISIVQTGSEWRVDWVLSFACHNAADACRLVGDLVAVEQSAHGDWEASLSLTQDASEATA